MASGARKDPLVVFVHIPKTAGSTINSALSRHFSTGQDHCEHIIDDPGRLTRIVATADWVSGHVPFHYLRAKLVQSTRRPLRFFSLLREPLDQVRSHYNWLIEIRRKGFRFYRKHPAHIRAISRDLRQSDNTDPAVIAGNLDKYAGIFLNMQARTLLGQGFKGKSDNVRDHLQSYEFVAGPFQIDTLLERMCGAAQPRPKPQNVARYHFDPSVFGAPELRKFLEQRNALDLALYEAVAAAVNPI